MPKKLKNNKRGRRPDSRHHGLPVVATIARGGCHGWTVVVATTVVANCSVFPFAAVRIPTVLRVYFRFAAIKA